MTQTGQKSPESKKVKIERKAKIRQAMYYFFADDFETNSFVFVTTPGSNNLI
jgi:hypothetical protein